MGTGLETRRLSGRQADSLVDQLLSQYRLDEVLTMLQRWLHSHGDREAAKALWDFVVTHTALRTGSQTS